MMSELNLSYEDQKISVLPNTSADVIASISPNSHKIQKMLIATDLSLINNKESLKTGSL